MMGCPGDGGWMMGAPMILWSLLLVGLVVAGVWLLWRAISGRSERPSVRSGSTARAILEERFARGEIDQDEFEQRRRALEE